MAVTTPPGRALAAACESVIRGWHQREPALEWDAVSAAFSTGDGGLTNAVTGLCLINCFQWHLEDECRVRYADTDRLAALKREIDESNRRRVRCIDAIDERLVRELNCAVDRGGTEAVVLITPGNLLDRISILELKRYHAPRGSEAAAIVEEQLDDACLGFDRLIADLAAAKQSLKLYRTVKLYGPGD
ncbi:MAG: hypothetical protein QOF27_1178 [Gaiellaceae bacterium]|nr:hypothetical protein [Gaiellaceae bacterium]